MKNFKKIKLFCAIPIVFLLSLPSIVQSVSEKISAPKEYDISLMAIGDNLMHMGIVRTGQQSDGSYDYSFLFSGIEDFLDVADVKVINQETPMAGNSLGFSGFPKFNSPTEVGDAIANAGFNVVLQATNHSADQGITGLKNVASFWTTNHPEVLMVGISEEADQSRIGLLTVEGVTFAILNYTYGPNAETLSSALKGHLNMLCAYDEKSGKIDFTTLNSQVIDDIEAANEMADVVIVFPHWGTEYQSSPTKYQRQWAEEMTQAGADLIIGTHPHVPEPVEWVTSENGNQSLCYYSLGNYVSTQQNELSMLEGMAWVTFHVTEGASIDIGDTANDITVEISTDNTGVIPMVCQYTSSPVRFDSVYLLEEYTDELAAKHGIHSYGGVNLTRPKLEQYAQDIFGDFIIKKSDALTTSDESNLILN